MKKITAIAICLVAAGTFLFLQCQNFTMPSSSSKTAETGNVAVSFSAGRAALSPADMDFTDYEFIFKQNGTLVSSSDKVKGNDFVFTLTTGKGYTLEVNCYVGSKSPGNLAATGTSGSFDITSSGASVLVSLTGRLSGGAQGRFTYAIDFPADAAVSELYLMNSEDAKIQLSRDGAAGMVAGSKELDAGWYFLIARLVNGKTAAGYANGVVIYPGQSTHFEKTFNENEFVIPPNTGPDVSVWHGFNVKGNSHYSMDNYIAGNAVGTAMDVYIDNQGGIYADVLKLKASGAGGYAEGTVIMTYPITQAGTYTLSMWYWVEPGNETANFYWQNTGGRYGTGPEAWQVFGGYGLDGTVPVSGGWHEYRESLLLRAGEEIGILARSQLDGAGLRDAVVYIRDIAVACKDIPIELSPATFNLAVGRTKTLTTNFANEDVQWTTSSLDIAGINNGIVTANSAGTATITAISKFDSTNKATAVVTVVAKNSKTIALTFDDGPHPVDTPKFLDVLAQKGAKATFFTIGYLVDAYPNIIRNIVNAGHEIGNHTYTHNESYADWWDLNKNNLPAGHNPMSPPEDYSELIMQRDENGIRKELIMTQNAVAKATAGSNPGSIVPTVMRSTALLYSSSDPWGQKEQHMSEELQFDDMLVQVAAGMGLALIDTTKHAEGDYDWNEAINTGSDAVVARVKELATDWGILLLHDGGVPERAVTRARVLDALPRILDWLHDEGYEVLSVSELVTKRNAGTLKPGEIYYKFSDAAQFEQGGKAGATVITLPQSSYTINGVGGTLSLTASVSGDFNRNVYWYSDNISVAKVGYSGNTVTVTAVGPGTATIRAAAANKSAAAEITVKVLFTTATNWLASPLNLPGHDGFAWSAGSPDRYFGSRAQTSVDDAYKPGDGYSHNKVLRLAPSEPGGYYYEHMVGGSLALNYEIPYDGEYTITMDALIDPANMSNSGEALAFVWWAANPAVEWKEVIRHGSVTTGTWMNGITGTVTLTKGTTIGLLTRDKGDGKDLKGATVYLRNFKLSMTGAVNDIIYITSTPTQVGDLGGIRFEWDNSGLNLIATGGNLTVNRGEKIQLTGPAAESYQWYVDGKAVTGANGAEFLFDTTKPDFAQPKTYNVALRARSLSGNYAMGDSVAITVK